MMDAFMRDLRQPEYVHVLLNPIPIYGLAIALLGLLIAVANLDEIIAVGAVTMEEDDQLARRAGMSRRTLIRRGYLDMVGLLPPLAEVEAFVNDPSPNAWEKRETLRRKTISFTTCQVCSKANEAIPPWLFSNSAKP